MPRSLVPLLLLAAACTHRGTPPAATPTAAVEGDGDASGLLLPEERRHLASLRQLTFGGENAEAYFSFDGTALVFQARRDGEACDQIYSMDLTGRDVRGLSPGGANTCAFFTPDGERVIFATTFLADPACPPPPDRSKGYVWPLRAAFDLVSVRRDGSDLRRLTDSPAYDAEATNAKDGRVVFTSARDGDLELYSMDLDGSHQRRLTETPGYDGGAFFSADGEQLVWRASRPAPGAALDEYRSLLSLELVKPGRLEIVVGDAQARNPRELTRNGAANFAPYFHPGGRAVIYSSNQGDPRGREFDLYLVPVAGGASERVTFAPAFDGFPMFSPDGRWLVFASNRGGRVPGETNVFLAEWRD
jgi:Tol biopolymer transport system component